MSKLSILSMMSIAALVILSSVIYPQTAELDKYPEKTEIVSSYQEPVYEKEIYKYTDAEEYPNGTYIEAKPVYRYVISRYETKYVTRDYVEYQKVRYYNYLKDGGETAVWNVPYGDRNTEDFPLCREYEKEKGVCFEI